MSEIRELGTEEAAENRKVKLRGVVTFYSERLGNAFLWDGTASIFFHPGKAENGTVLKFTTGELIEIEGVTVKGKYSPSVAGAPPSVAGELPEAVRVKRLGWGELPEPVAITG